MSASVACPECGALVPDVDGPVHAYVPAAPGCWRTFGEVQADEMARFGYPDVHRLVVDAYMAQHPGDGSDPRARRSVLAHLVGLCATLERGLPTRYVTDVPGVLASARRDAPALHRGGGPGALTVLHMVGAADLADYERRAREWGEEVWRSWAEHHDLVRAELDDVLARAGRE